MKKLVMVTGAPGVGKTAVCRELFSRIEGCAWLDSDWCWMINPWSPKTTEQKRYVEGTFERILKGYLENDAIHVVLFSWVMTSQHMFDLITDRLTEFSLEVFRVALVCDAEQHKRRMMLDARPAHHLDSAGHMASYYDLHAEVLDVSSITPREAALKIRELIGE
ncbi:MAG: AAA family ATPase [Bacillota bacterium]